MGTGAVIGFVIHDHVQETQSAIQTFRAQHRHDPQDRGIADPWGGLVTPASAAQHRFGSVEQLPVGQRSRQLKLRPCAHSRIGYRVFDGPKFGCYDLDASRSCAARQASRLVWDKARSDDRGTTEIPRRG